MEYREIIASLTASLYQVNSSYALMAKKYNLTYNALMTLYVVDSYEDVNQKFVSDTLFLSKSTVHTILESLERKDILCLVAGNNKKEKFIRFSESGEQFFSSIRTDTEEFEFKVLDYIGERDCVALVKQAKRMSAKMLSEARIISETQEVRHA